MKCLRPWSTCKTHLTCLLSIPSRRVALAISWCICVCSGNCNRIKPRFCGCSSRLHRPANRARQRWPAAQRAISLQRLLEQKGASSHEFEHQPVVSVSDRYGRARCVEHAEPGFVRPCSAWPIPSVVRPSGGLRLRKCSGRLSSWPTWGIRCSVAAICSPVHERRSSPSGFRQPARTWAMKPNCKDSDIDMLSDTNLPGNQILGGYSNEVQGSVDLNPIRC